MVVRTVPEASASTMRRLYSSCAYASWLATRRVPTQTASAPRASAATTPRPSAMPPAAMTRTGAMASTTAGTSVRTVPVLRLCPPASVPCTTTASAPQRTASCASCSEQAADESRGGIVPEEADHRDPLLHTDIQLSLLGKLRDEVHAERSRGHGSGHANELT